MAYLCSPSQIAHARRVVTEPELAAEISTDLRAVAWAILSNARLYRIEEAQQHRLPAAGPGDAA